MADFESEIAQTRSASPVELHVQQQDIESQVQPHSKSIKVWTDIPLWKRRTFLIILSVILLLTVILSVVYGVVYVLIVSGFHGNSSYPSFEMSGLKDGSINTRLVYTYNITSSLPLILHDYNLSYSADEGKFGQMLMPGYFISTKTLDFQADTVMYITNETILGSFGNQALSILTGTSNEVVPRRVYLASDLSVNCGIPGLTFIHWTIPYRSTVPFKLTSLGNLGSIMAKPAPLTEQQPEMLKTQHQLQSEQQQSNSTDVTIFPVLKKKNATASVSKVRLAVPRFWFQATVNFTNPVPLALKLSLLKGQIYSYENRLAEVFVSEFGLKQGNNSIQFTFWLNDFKGFVKTACGTVFRGINKYQFSLRNITVQGERGTVKWVNHWFSNITLQLPRVKVSSRRIS